MKKLERRDFIKAATFSAAAFTVASGIPGCGNNEKKNNTSGYSGKTFNWRMVTTWSPHFPLLGEYADKMAVLIDEMSGGRLKIQVYGGGELVPALETFDAVSQGVAEMGHGAPYYWAGKIPAAQFFSGIPFGMNTQQTNAWLFDGGGIQLWEQTYAPHNLIPFVCGNTGGQMGGWFNKEINSLADLQGLKIRMPGLGGKVITKAGASAILSPGSELYTNLERGVIDALEWIGPYHDYLMGFHKIAKYYYSPGWQEPTGTLELIVNKNAYESLPADLQSIIRCAASAVTMQLLSGFEQKNAEYLLKLKNEDKINLKDFPDDVLNKLKEFALQVFNEITNADAQSKKVYESYKEFQIQTHEWTAIAEKNY